MCVRPGYQLLLFVPQQVHTLYPWPHARCTRILSRPGARCSGTELDAVHIGEGLHEDNLLDGQDVVVVTRKGDKIKGHMP